MTDWIFPPAKLKSNDTLLGFFVREAFSCASSLALALLAMDGAGFTGGRLGGSALFELKVVVVSSVVIAGTATLFAHVRRK